MQLCILKKRIDKANDRVAKRSQNHLLRNIDNSQLQILILNDRKIYNGRYRQPIVDGLTARGHHIDDLGLLDSFSVFCRIFFRLLSSKDKLVISSNIKSNVFTLLVARCSKIIIINGFGRYRKSYWARWIIRSLLIIRHDTFALVQNYADYRYLRRHCTDLQMEWIPGSGGSRKHVGRRGAMVLVQRDNKVALVAPDVLDLLGKSKQKHQLIVVGCTDSRQLDRIFGVDAYRSTGYVESSQIFSEGAIFLQPEGYGEGFPHTLADAIVSGMTIYISDREFMRYGLAKLGGMREILVPGWSRLIQSQNVIAAVHKEAIAARICDICDTYEHEDSVHTV